MSARAQALGGRPAALVAPIAQGGTPWLIAIVVAVASFMEVLDTTIANVALRYIAGGLGISQDEASWVVTTYLVANAIIVTATSYLVRRIGRKAFFLGCLAVFTLSSMLCGIAWNLQVLLMFRLVQGFAGGGMVPVAQSILADSFPPAKRGQAFALFAIAVVVAPVVGPTLGGWLSDNLSWHWCFLINVPVGIFALVAVSVLVKDTRQKTSDGGFDLVGFLLVATALGALEMVLDRGQQDDWFGSHFIVTFAIISAVAFLFLIPWEATRKNPTADVRLVATRQFGSAFLVMMATGAILLATTQFLPQLVQEDFGYTATWAGLVLAPGGVVTLLASVVTGRVSGFVQPKYLIAIGATLVAFSMYQMTNIEPNLDFWFFAHSRMLLGAGLPMIFVSITAASYDGIPPEKIDQASALLNAARNTGSSIGVALASNVLAHREQFHQSRLVEQAIPSGVSYQETLHQVTQYFLAQGGSLAQAQRQAFAWIGQQMQAQASLLAYVDVFWVLMVIAALTVPLALALRNIKLGGPAHMGH